MKLILASGSPRRRELLTQVGAVFEVEKSDVEELTDPSWSPKETVRHLAEIKALAVAQKHEEGIVLGADTVVVDGDKVLGKPEDKEDAKAMLKGLSGRSHEVMTAVVLVDASGEKPLWGSVETTKVKFKTLSDEEIEAYVLTGESMDKAGAYGIQGYGALLVEQLEGCYFNVVGLPLVKTAEGLKKFGIDLYRFPSDSESK